VRESVLNWPNAITSLRLLAIPALTWFALHGDWGVACLLFVGAAATDGLDGYLARRLQQTTALGAILDTLTDKALGLSTLGLLALHGLLPLWLAGGLVTRDLVIVLAALIYRGLVGEMQVAPPFLGKFNTFLEFAVFALLLGEAAGWLYFSPVATAFFVVLLGTAVISAAQILHVWWHRGRQHLRRRLNK
jgi:cardiolipin synthase